MTTTKPLTASIVIGWIPDYACLHRRGGVLFRGMPGGDEMSELPWNERVAMLSINPDAATRDDVARMAAELMEANHKINRAKEQVAETIALLKAVQ